MASNDTSENSYHRPRQRNALPPYRRQGRNKPPMQQYQTKQQTQGLAEKRKPVFVKVDQLKPGMNGHNLTVKVIDQSFPLLLTSGLLESLIGDETASILFTARNNLILGTIQLSVRYQSLIPVL